MLNTPGSRHSSASPTRGLVDIIAEEGVRRMLTPVLATTAMAQILVTLATLSVAVLAPEIALSIETAAGLVGLQIAILRSGSVLSSLVASDVVFRYGAARATQSALALAALGLVLIKIGELWALALGSLVIGLGSGFTNPAAAHLLARVVGPRQRNLVFSIKQASVPAGALLAGGLLPPMALVFGWRFGLAAAAILCVAVAVWVERRRAAWDSSRDRDRIIGTRPFASIRLVWREPRLRHLCSTCVALASVQLLVLGYTVTLLVETWGYSLVAAGWALVSFRWRVLPAASRGARPPIAISVAVERC